MVDETRITTATGIPVGDNQNSLTAGPRGPLLVQDWQLFEKHAHFNRERIPERVVHAKGSGAYGTLTVTGDITQYTKAALFSEVGKQTSCFFRFSTVAGERGAADAERDVRGFAMKFYTQEGNWDLVGNNTPALSSRATPTSSPTSSTPRNATQRPTSATLPPCGTSGPSPRRASTRSQCSSPTAASQSRTVT